MHGPGTRPDATVEWAFEQGHVVDIRYLFRGDEIPLLSEFDWLVTTGGPMNSTDDENFPFLAREAQLIQQAISAGKAVLGLCLGAQLIARAMGAKVHRNAHWEVGWHSVRVDDAYLGKGDFVVFQWHQDTFDLPEGAARIATNSITENQAFRISPRVVATQFHPEAVTKWIQESAVDPVYPAGPFVQLPNDIVQGLIHLPAMNYWFRRLLHQIEGDL